MPKADRPPARSLLAFLKLLHDKCDGVTSQASPLFTHAGIHPGARLLVHKS